MFDANIVSQRPSSEKATALDVDDVDDDDDDDDDDGSHPAEDRYHLLCSRCGWRLSVKNIIGEDFPHLNRKPAELLSVAAFFGCISHQPLGGLSWSDTSHS